MTDIHCAFLHSKNSLGSPWVFNKLFLWYWPVPNHFLLFATCLRFLRISEFWIYRRISTLWIDSSQVICIINFGRFCHLYKSLEVITVINPQTFSSSFTKSFAYKQKVTITLKNFSNQLVTIWHALMFFSGLFV